MIRLVLWLLWVWLMMSWLESYWVLFLKDPKPFVGLATTVGITVAALMRWACDSEIRGAKAATEGLKAKVEALESRLKGEEVLRLRQERDLDENLKNAKELSERLEEKNAEVASLTEENQRLADSQLAFNGTFHLTEDGYGPYCSDCWTERKDVSKLSKTYREDLLEEWSCPKCDFKHVGHFGGESAQLPSMWRGKSQ